MASPLTDLQFDIQESITGGDLERAEGLIRSLANREGGAAPQALALNKQLFKARQEAEKGRRRTAGLTGVEAPAALGTTQDLTSLTPGSRTVDLERLEDVDAPEGIRRLEQFQLPAGTLQPGEREAGRIVTSEGDFARALIQRDAPTAPKRPSEKLSPRERLAKRAELEADGVSEATLKQWDELQKPTNEDLLDSVVAEVDPGRDPTLPFSRKQKAFLQENGMSVEQIKQLDDEAVRAAKSREDIDERIRLEAALRKDEQNVRVPASALGKYVNPTTLKVPPRSTTNKQLEALETSGQVIRLQSIKELSDINAVPAALESLKQFKLLARGNPSVFPSFEKVGKVSALGTISLNRSQIALGLAAVNPVFAKLNAIRIALVPIIKAFGDTGNIAVKEADRALEALGLTSTSLESVEAAVDVIFAGLAAGIRARKVNPQFLIDAEKILKEAKKSKPKEVGVQGFLEDK